MNRRNFLKGILAACVAPQVLPGAGRSWKRVENLLVPNDNWQVAPYEYFFLADEKTSKIMQEAIMRYYRDKKTDKFSLVQTADKNAPFEKTIIWEGETTAHLIEV